MQDSRIPTEVCERIIDFSRLSSDHRGSVNEVDYPTLRSCSLVCRAWLPRSRYNMFFRVILHTSMQLQKFLSLRTHYPVREVELSSQDMDRHNVVDTNIMGPSIAPLIRANLVNEVYLLACWNMSWLYPRIYVSFLSRLESLRILELHGMYFPNAGDMIGLLRCFPRLQDLTCEGLGLQFPGTMHHEAHRRAKPQDLHRVEVDGCGGTAPFILQSVVGSAPWLRVLSIRSSFFCWQPHDYRVLSAFSNVASLTITLASPTQDRRLSPGRSLISLYREGVEGVLTHIGTAGSSSDKATALREISIVIEPGYGTVPSLSGMRGPAGREPVIANKDYLYQVIEDPRQWSYGMGRAAAGEGLLGTGFEQLLVDTNKGRLRSSFSGLQTLSVRLWDPYEGEQCAWWFDEISKQLSVLHALQILQVEVRVDWEHVHGNSLWLAG